MKLREKFNCIALLSMSLSASVALGDQPALEVEVKNDAGAPLSVTGSVNVEFPTNQAVTVTNLPLNQDVTVTNLPAVQDVNVTNLPAVQDVEITNSEVPVVVTNTNIPVVVSRPVPVRFGEYTINVGGGFGQEFNPPGPIENFVLTDILVSTNEGASCEVELRDPALEPNGGLYRYYVGSAAESKTYDKHISFATGLRGVRITVSSFGTCTGSVLFTGYFIE